MRRLLFLFVVLSVCVKATAQTNIPALNPHDLSISWQALQNNYQNKAQSLNALTITNNGQQTLPASDWKLYFNSARNIISTTVHPLPYNSSARSWLSILPMPPKAFTWFGMRSPVKAMQRGHLPCFHSRQTTRAWLRLPLSTSKIRSSRIYLSSNLPKCSRHL